MTDNLPSGVERHATELYAICERLVKWSTKAEGWIGEIIQDASTLIQSIKEGK